MCELGVVLPRRPFLTRLAPSVVMKTGKNSHLEIGLTGGVIGDKSYGVKLGFWRDF